MKMSKKYYEDSEEIEKIECQLFLLRGHCIGIIAELSMKNRYKILDYISDVMDFCTLVNQLCKKYEHGGYEKEKYGNPELHNGIQKMWNKIIKRRTLKWEEQDKCIRLQERLKKICVTMTGYPKNITKCKFLRRNIDE